MIQKLSFTISILLLILTRPAVGADGVLDTFYEVTGLESVSNGGLTAFPVLEMPTGSLQDAMGGAYTAVDDCEGYFDGNPAATAGCIESVLTIHHQEWIDDASVESVVFTRSYGTAGIGVGVKAFRVPFTEYDDVGTRSGGGYFAESVAAMNLSVLFVDFSRFRSSIGVTVKGVVRYVSSGITLGQSAFSVPFDIGLRLQFRFLPIRVHDPLNFSAGISVRDFCRANETLGAALPTRFSAGIAYKPFDALLLSGDFVLPVSFDPEATPAEPFYGSAGLSVSVTRFFDIQTGVRIRSGDFRMSLGAAIHLSPLNFVTTYMIGPANGFGPGESLSAAMSLDLIEASR